MNVYQIVEAVLFASDAPLTAHEIARADEGLDEDLQEVGGPRPTQVQCLEGDGWQAHTQGAVQAEEARGEGL